MEQTWAARLGAPLIAALAVLTTACTSSAGAGVSGAPPESPAPTPLAAITEPETEPFTVPDLTERPIGIDDLRAMLPNGETGPSATDAPAYSSRSNEELVTTAVLDRSDEVADIDRHRRVTGVAASYPSDASVAHVWIDLFDTAAGAAGWVTDTAGDIVKRTGGSHQPRIDLVAATEYPFGVGEGPIGLILNLDEGATETLALFHIGRLAIFTSIVRDDAADARVPVQYLAEETADRVLVVLRGASPGGAPADVPGSFEFAYERTVEIGEDRWHATSSGTVDGASITCRVIVNHPDLALDRSLVLVDGVLWTRDAGGDYRESGSAGAIDRQLLDLCPAWPVDLHRAGLSGTLEEEPATHEIGGVAALGYRGSAEDRGGNHLSERTRSCPRRQHGFADPTHRHRVPGRFVGECHHLSDDQRHRQRVPGQTSRLTTASP
jgi:hypothetical protein